MAYGFNDDKSKVEVYKKEDFTINSIETTDNTSRTVSANSLLSTSVSLNGFPSNGHALGVLEVNIKSSYENQSKLCLSGFSVSKRAGDTVPKVNVLIINTSSSSITISAITVKVSYLDIQE